MDAPVDPAQVMSAPLAPHAAALHALLSPLSPAVALLRPALRAIAPYGAAFDAAFARLLGPAHPLSAGFPLMVPHHVALIAVAYLLFVVAVPPALRAAGVALRLKPAMRAYNLFMVLLSAYMGTRSVWLARRSGGPLFCVPLGGDTGEEMAQLVWVFTYSKVLEFLDTVFMVWEGRMRQVSFLHVYHHVTILSYWFAILWMAPGSDAYFSLAGNSFIHVIMYAYYLLASFGYSPWWKYYITKAQIFQFCCFCVQSVYVGYVMTDKRCDFPNLLSRGLLWYMLSLIALFTHFLLTNKGKGKDKNKKKTAAAASDLPLKPKAQ